MPTAPAPPDHRPRVAAERRERMRRRLIESALIVFARKGTGASVIQEVVAAAEVSQGSFYNHFRTNDELLAAVSTALSNEIVQLIETVVGDIEDPAQRVATGIRCYLHLVRSYPVVARFLAAAGLRPAAQGNAIHDVLPPDIRQGQRRGQFDPGPVGMAVDALQGIGLIAVHRMAARRTPRDYPDRVVATMLRTLGVDRAAAARLVALPLPRLLAAADSLLARAQARATEADGDAVASQRA